MSIKGKVQTNPAHTRTPSYRHFRHVRGKTNANPNSARPNRTEFKRNKIRGHRVRIAGAHAFPRPRIDVRPSPIRPLKPQVGARAFGIARPWHGGKAHTADPSRGIRDCLSLAQATRSPPPRLLPHDRCSVTLPSQPSSCSPSADALLLNAHRPAHLYIPCKLAV
jgi:hypothetical protein